jgi:hypothetical protein
MASTINASTSPAAIIQTADGTAILALQTGNTTAVTIDASQNVTFAKTISALAVGGNITQSNNVTAGFSGSTTAGTYTDTGASLTLNAGTYLILSNAVLSVTGQSGTTVAFRMPSLAFTDNSNNISFFIYASGASTNSSLANITLCNILTVPSTTTYKTRFSSVNNSGSPTITGLDFTASATAIHNIIAIRLT